MAKSPRLSCGASTKQAIEKEEQNLGSLNWDFFYG